MLNHKLTQKEQELLVITMEECCELAMVCSKLLRFGKEKEHLDNLLQETADVSVMINLISDYRLVNPVQRFRHMLKKQDKLKEWSSLY